MSCAVHVYNKQGHFRQVQLHMLQSGYTRQTSLNQERAKESEIYLAAKASSCTYQIGQRVANPSMTLPVYRIRIIHCSCHSIEDEAPNWRRYRDPTGNIRQYGNIQHQSRTPIICKYGNIPPIQTEMICIEHLADENRQNTEKHPIGAA